MKPEETESDRLEPPDPRMSAMEAEYALGAHMVECGVVGSSLTPALLEAMRARCQVRLDGGLAFGALVAPMSVRVDIVGEVGSRRVGLWVSHK